MLLAATLDGQRDPIAEAFLLDDVLDLAWLRDLLAVNCGYDIVLFQRALRRALIQNFRDGDLHRQVEVIHCGDGRGRLGLGKGLLIGLFHLFIAHVLRDDGIDGHDGVIGHHPAAQRLGQGHIGAHGDRGHVEVAVGVIGFRRLNINDLSAVYLTQRVHRGTGPLSGIRDGQRHIGAGDVVKRYQSTSEDDGDGAPGDGADATASRRIHGSIPYNLCRSVRCQRSGDHGK